MGAAIQNSVDTSVPTIVRSRVRTSSESSAYFFFLILSILFFIIRVSIHGTLTGVHLLATRKNLTSYQLDYGAGFKS